MLHIQQLKETVLRAFCINRDEDLSGIRIQECFQLVRYKQPAGPLLYARQDDT